MTQSLTPELVRRIGEALYGESWRSELSRALDVADRTVRRWVAGTDQPRPTITLEVVELLSARRAELAELIEEVGRLAQ